MTRRRLRPEEARLWALVASTVASRHTTARAAEPEEAPPECPAPPAVASLLRPRVSSEGLAMLLEAGVSGLTGDRSRGRGSPAGPRGPAPPDPIEPNRKRRIARAREPIGARLDLHGYDQDRARAALHGFIAQAQAQGARAVLVITGKGRIGEGLLRRLTPEWLAEPPSRERVAGVSVADARHGGEGALYVALKRRS